MPDPQILPPEPPSEGPSGPFPFDVTPPIVPDPTELGPITE